MNIVSAGSGLLAVVQLCQSGLSRPTPKRGTKLEQDRPDDLTGAQVKQLLAELTTLTGDTVHARPVLELLIGEILTRTSVEPAGQDLYLSVTGLLPPCDALLPPHAVMPAELDEQERRGFELLWHADEGRYIVVRKIALRNLSDERSVMDEILNTADLAQRCQARIAGE